MQNFSMLIQGFGTALTPMNIGVCMLGAVLGLIVGCNARHWFSGRCRTAFAADIQV